MCLGFNQENTKVFMKTPITDEEEVTLSLSRRYY